MIKKAIPGLVVLFFLLFFLNVDFRLAALMLDKVRWKIFGILIISGFAYILATISWRLCFEKSDDNLNYKSLFSIRLIGESLSVSNPTGIIGGDALKVLILKTKNIPYENALQSVVVSRGLTVLSFLLILFTSSFFLLRISLSANSWITAVMNLAVAITASFYCFKVLSSPSLMIYKLVKKLDKIFFDTIGSGLLKKLKYLNIKIAIFFRDRRSQLVLAFLLLVIHWIFGALEYYYIMLVLDDPIRFNESLILEFGTSLSRSLFAFIPFQIGIEEMSHKVLFQLIGIQSEETWLTVSILKRIRQLFWISLALSAYIFYYKNRISSLIKLS